MKKYMKAHWMEYVFALLLIGIASVGISYVFGYSFSTNDDAMLRNIVCGNYTGEPDAHLIYIMYPLGWIWKTLYGFAPAVPWYDLTMVGLHYICWFLLVVRVMQLVPKKAAKVVAAILALGVIAIIDLPYLVMHQYTILAAVLASVAIFWLITGKEQSGKEYWIDRIVCILLMILCLWLRKQIFIMALPIGFLILWREFWGAHKQNKKQCLKNIGIFLGIIGLLTALSFAAEHFAYSSEQWEDFKVYNEARTEIYDYYGVPKYDEYEQAYADIGIGYGDWVVLDHYDTGLIADLTTDKLSKIAEWSVAEKKESQQYYSVLRKGLYSVTEVLFYNQVQPVGLILSILYVLGVLCAYKYNDKNGFLCLCAMLLFQAVFIGYFMEQGRFPERISYGLYFMQVCYLAGMILQSVSFRDAFAKKADFRLPATIGLCLAVLLIVGFYRVRITLNENNVIRGEVQDWEYVNDYFEANADKKYCIITKSFVFSKELMFQDEKSESDNLIRLGSWVQNSPLEENHNNRIGVSNLAKSIQTNPDICLVEDANADLWWLESYLAGSGKTPVTVDVLTTPGGREFAIIQLQ